MSSSQPRRGFIARRLQGWMLRHQLPSNFAIHMVGIPMTLVAIGLLAILPWDMWWVGRSDTERWEEPLYDRQAECCAQARGLSLEEFLKLESKK